MFSRQNNDLIYTENISLEKVRLIEIFAGSASLLPGLSEWRDGLCTSQALTGFSVEVETLDGRLLNIPVNDIVW